MTTTPRARPEPAPKARRRRWWPLALVGVVLLPILSLCLGLLAVPGPTRELLQPAVQFVDRPPWGDDKSQVFSVKPGEDLGSVAQRLEAAGLVRSGWWFRLLAHYYGVNDGLRPGDYRLSRWQSATDILSQLHHSLVAPTDVAIAPGWRLEQTARKLEESGAFEARAFNEALTRAAQRDFLQGRPAGASLEGYLFPDTYKLKPGQGPESYIEQALDEFGRTITPEMRAAAANVGLTFHQAVTLASIVEREALLDRERPLIASVYLNRLKQGAKLQADPTVQYALGSRAGSNDRESLWKSRLSLQDLEIDSPYNTYRYAGLPPGPICSPGLESYKAVISPARTDYLFFVAKGDGSHAFATTYEEHEANVRKYQGER